MLGIMSIFLSTAVLFTLKKKLCFKTPKLQNQERKNNGVNKNQEGELYYKWSFATTQLLARQGNTTLEKWWWLEAMFSDFWKFCKPILIRRVLSVWILSPFKKLSTLFLILYLITNIINHVIEDVDGKVNLKCFNL